MKWRIVVGIGLILLPFSGHAQDIDLSGDISGLEATLNTVYDAMIVKCGSLISISTLIAGFAALWYVAVRIWERLSHALPVDVFPLLRPFVIGFAISIFPSVIALINGVMQPTVSGTAALVTDSKQALTTLLQERENDLQQSNEWQEFVGLSSSGDLDKWEQLSGDADSGVFSGISNRVKFEMAKISYNLKNSIKVWLSEILQILFEAAALCINTVRTFYLIILAILGPLAFGFSVFDGFRHLLVRWLGRYINVFLWLPIANIYGSLINSIQQEMIKLDIAQVQATGQTSFGATDSAYLVFLIMAIVGYFTVPSIAGYIISAGSMQSYTSKITNAFTSWKE